MLVVAAYEKFRQLIIKKDVAGMAATVYDKEKEVAQTYFMDEALSLERKEDHLEFCTIPGLKPIPLENYKAVFYGNGRMIALRRTDYLGKYALVSKYINEQGNVRMIHHYYVLLRTKGSKELIPIR
ncbi:hypothetical protein [Cellulophaga lytica]|uniref:hypothetical protein n=1 Tax=Cellulophaga lytica TaxID=979 RepID=UPI000B5C32E5|nr:hypothetical protein [Cellulophaga lytica]SNQ42380.1 hypothetical protein CL8139_150008 [Cellulophaga lytica]